MKREGFDNCGWCGEIILPGEPQSPAMLDAKPLHLECGFRMVAGGANHILKQCTCCGGSEPPDPKGMTKREAAQWSFKVAGWVRELIKVTRGHDAGTD